jgi:hypothetical protein
METGINYLQQHIKQCSMAFAKKKRSFRFGFQLLVLPFLEAHHQCFGKLYSFDAPNAIGDKPAQFLQCSCLPPNDEVVAAEDAEDIFDAFDFAEFFFHSFHEVQGFT